MAATAKAWEKGISGVTLESGSWTWAMEVEVYNAGGSVANPTTISAFISGGSGSTPSFPSETARASAIADAVENLAGAANTIAPLGVYLSQYTTLPVL